MTLWEARFSWIWLGNCACRLWSRGENFKFFSASRRKIWNSLLLTPTYAHNFSQIHPNLASQSVISAKNTFKSWLKEIHFSRKTKDERRNACWDDWALRHASQGEGDPHRPVLRQEVGGQPQPDPDNKAILNSGFALYHVLHPAMLIPMLCHFQNCPSFHSSPTISHVGIFEQDRKFLECRLQCKPQQWKFKWL